MRTRTGAVQTFIPNLFLKINQVKTKIMNEIIARLTTEMPNFFKTVAKIGGILTGLSVLIMGINAQFPDIVIPAFIETVAKYCAVAGMVMVGVANLAVKDYDALQNKINDVK